MSTAKLKEFWLKYEQKIVLLIGFLLVSAISFEFGLLQGQKWQQKPLVIEKLANAPQEGRTSQEEAPAAPQGTFGAKTSQAKTESAAPASIVGCAFVGSKNSDKFYVPSCQFAKRVKPENLVCYKSEQEALAKGKTKSDCK